MVSPQAGSNRVNYPAMAFISKAPFGRFFLLQLRDHADGVFAADHDAGRILPA